MSLQELADITSSEEAAIGFLRGRNALRRTPPDCPTCLAPMNRVFVRKRSQFWRCSRHTSVSKSIRSGSFWDKCHITMVQAVRLVYNWAYQVPVKHSVDQIGLSETRIIQWNQFIRDLCSWDLLHRPIEIGGPGLTVQIDESQVAKRKYHRGRYVPGSERWVFGGVCPQTGEGFLELVPNRRAETLLQVIERRIRPGSTINSDMFASYNGIQNIPVNPPYVHNVVNHKENFVCPLTGTHTNHVENYWKNAKLAFKRMCGVQGTNLESHLDEFLWREKLDPKTGQESFYRILEVMSQRYPTP